MNRLEPSAPTPLRMWLVAATFVLGTAGLLLATGGNLGVALAPAALVAVLYGVARAPVGVTACALLAAGLLFDNPYEQPGMGLFRTPLYAPGSLLYNTFEKTLRLPGAKVYAIEALCLGLAALVLLRARKPRDDEEPGPASPLAAAVRVAFLALLFWEVYGLARGGSMRFSLLQVRTVLFAFTLPLVFAWCFRARGYVTAVVAIVLSVACVRSLFAVYYWATVIRHDIRGSADPGGGAYVLTHSDTVLLVTALVTVLAWLVMRPSRRSALLAAVVVPVVGLGVIVNNRRLAIVSLVISLGLIYLVSSRAIRRRLNLVGAALVPFVLAYIAVAWSSTAPWAAPVQALKSVILPGDASAETRDIENYNLVVTLRQGPLLGQGFGHEYIEQVRAYDISHAFEAYRYVPHNSVLWLYSAMGVVGFTLMWMLLAVGAFLAVRTFHLAQRDDERLISLVTVAVIAIYGLQAYGDMGLGSWMGALLFSAHLGLVGAAATRVGAWPSRAPQGPGATSSTVTE